MKIQIPRKISDYFSSYKHKFNYQKNEWDDIICPVIGKLFWIVPDEILWLYSTNNDEGYEGSQTQFGVKRDGTVVWGYFSHCSCYGYESYKGEFEELKDENEIHTRKTYELQDVDSRVLEILKDRLREISKLGIRDIKAEISDGGKEWKM